MLNPWYIFIVDSLRQVLLKKSTNPSYFYASIELIIILFLAVSKG